MLSNLVWTELKIENLIFIIIIIIIIVISYDMSYLRSIINDGYIIVGNLPLTDKQETWNFPY